MDREIKHIGTIDQIQGKSIFVKITQHSACSGCHANSICSVSEKKDKIIEITNCKRPEEFKVHEKVMISGKSSLGLLAVLYAFIIPVVIILITMLLSQRLFEEETTSALCGFTSLLIYYFILYLCRNKLKHKFIFTIEKLN